MCNRYLCKQLAASGAELARRWSELIREFTQGDPEIEKGLKALYSDKQNRPSTVQQGFESEAAQFICAAQNAKK